MTPTLTSRTELTAGWTLRAVGGDVPPELAGVSVPATVPGCVHLDLLAAGLIPDPYLDENEKLLGWIGRVDWRYETTFGWDGPNDSTDLVALGLDTVAVVELNGAVVAETRNMHRSYRIPVSDLLHQGTNTLAVTFTGALTAAEQAEKELGARPHVNRHPYNAIRKMASDYGWDWGPEIMTAGIWRPLYLESWRQAGIDAVRPLVALDGDTGVVSVFVDLRWAPESAEPLRMEVSVGDVLSSVDVPAGLRSAFAEVRVPLAKKWWPHGYGEQPLYDIGVRLLGDDVVLDAWHGRIGFRTVELDTTPDEHGTPFTLVVNGQPVFARGVNWVPGDCFPSRVGPELYEQRLIQAREANVNLIRVWGGGIYESDAFYDLCDELGLLVWQDFLLACAAYSEEEPLRSEIIAEACEAVTRLSPHPSLALWNGGNENVWGYHDWGWQEELDGRSWGWQYYSQILPDIVRELDPTRPYVPGSPYSPDPALHPNDPDHGTMHMWDVWNELDYTRYRDHTPRFASEFGFQGPPTLSTLTRAVHDRPLRVGSAAMLVHQKADDGDGKLARGLAGHLPAPATFEDWHWAASLNQARAVAFGVEHLRSLTPRCMGAVVWQLNDVWPVVSWSAVDGDGRRKPLWFALRRAFRDRLLTIQPRPDGLTLVAVNDSGEPWRAEVPVTRFDIDGTALASQMVSVEVAARGVAAWVLPPRITEPDDPARELIAAGLGADRTLSPFREDVDAALPEARLRTRVERVATGYRVTVIAETYVRDLALLADQVAADAQVDDALVTLLPGEQAVFDVRTSALVDPDAFDDPAVLRSANQLVTGDGVADVRGGGR
ncbi:beta-mannosidase [Catenulispora acidiphila DSM 44928]|uniref:beta-mannosidase n=1 Tax=Catenulispora acidiphila (strain DSM 44928 / JCM 14897 / NBRC 102108 / NRRL B-24433 / ID139908) TaxID=479433 RepID=C7QC05_CATAD|nr:glycoside hydrolase family 2 protein [Catenulispora acidiphila]ACU72624.1 beta-mannosidase [Catenulispora acidiphila DSM 44928]